MRWTKGPYYASVRQTPHVPAARRDKRQRRDSKFVKAGLAWRNRSNALSIQQNAFYLLSGPIWIIIHPNA